MDKGVVSVCAGFFCLVSVLSLSACQVEESNADVVSEEPFIHPSEYEAETYDKFYKNCWVDLTLKNGKVIHLLGVRWARADKRTDNQYGFSVFWFGFNYKYWWVNSELLLNKAKSDLIIDKSFRAEDNNEDPYYSGSYEGVYYKYFIFLPLNQVHSVEGDRMYIGEDYDYEVFD